MKFYLGFIVKILFIYNKILLPMKKSVTKIFTEYGIVINYFIYKVVRGG